MEQTEAGKKIYEMAKSLLGQEIIHNDKVSNNYSPADRRIKQELREKKLRKTSSFNKIWNYINSLTEDITFQRKIAQIRKKYNIPSNGIPPAGIKYMDTHTDTGVVKTRMAPDFLDERVWIDFTKEVNEFAEEEYALLPNWSGHTIREYILYNILEMPELGSLSLFKVVDIKSFLEDRKYTEKELREADRMTFEEKIARLRYISRRYPLAILISPYAAEREIVDYVKNLYNLEIKPIQKKYRNPNIRLGKTRKRNEEKKARNRFIYENKDTPSKQLVHLVYEKFGDTLDYTHINKIIKEKNEKISVHG